MNRIDKKFKELKKLNRKAFIPYICYGDPNIEITKDLVLELSYSGADLIELGYPFSDPLADGPTIQSATERALKHNISIKKYFQTIKDLRKKTDIPIVIMTYYNLIFNYRLETFIKEAVKAGLDGAVIPDLPIEESDCLRRITKKHNFDLIFLISPTTPKSRMEKIVRKSAGFIYYVSLTGVTGAKDNLAFTLKGDIRSLKEITDKPICVGFGISQPIHVQKISEIADGVIVGSAIIDIIHKNISNKKLVSTVGKFVRKLAKSTQVIS